MTPQDHPEAVLAAQAGDESAFQDLVEGYRRELQVHCYRMVGSFEDAEDLLQETYLKAWQKLGSFEGRSTLRRWLYQIATNTCLDFLTAVKRRPVVQQPSGGAPGAAPNPVEIPWLEPFPDRLLDESSSEPTPDDVVVARETIELTFLAALQHLPARQRAVLILRDVLGWSAKESAALLETSVASVNSALQRARPVLRERLPERRVDWAAGAGPSEDDQVLVQRYADAYENGDAATVAEMLSADVRMTMPPMPMVWLGLDAVMDVFTPELLSPGVGDVLVIPTATNRQPAVAFYVRRPGEPGFRAYGIGVLRIEQGKIIELIGFGPDRFESFGLPAGFEDLTELDRSR